jgi:hypothetical protein
MKYLEKISSFDENNLISLDEAVMWALELFSLNSLEKIDILEFKKPLIMGSWNAIVTAKIIFSWINALFCDETNFLDYIKRDMDWLIILSASGNKHAVIFTRKAKELWIKTKLITCNPESQAGEILWKENTIITQKNREPYTYNTSTYLWWVLAFTWEKASDIKEFISDKIDPILKKIDFSKFDSYLLVTPDKFSWVNQLFIVKFIELFGRKIARDVFSYGQVKHAITLIPHNTELCISFWEWELDYKWNHINFPLPKNWNLWSIMAIGYYVIWNIQKSHPDFFKQNIWAYIDNMNKTDFWKWAKIIV